MSHEFTAGDRVRVKSTGRLGIVIDRPPVPVSSDDVISGTVRLPPLIKFEDGQSEETPVDDLERLE